MFKFAMFAHKKIFGWRPLPECALFRVPIYDMLSSVWKNNHGTYLRSSSVVSAKQNDHFLHFWTFFMATWLDVRNSSLSINSFIITWFYILYLLVCVIFSLLTLCPFLKKIKRRCWRHEIKVPNLLWRKHCNEPTCQQHPPTLPFNQLTAFVVNLQRFSSKKVNFDRTDCKLSLTMCDHSTLIHYTTFIMH